MKIKIIITFFVVVSFTLPALANVEPSQNSERVKEISKVANKIASTYHDMGWFSGTVLVAKDGDVIFSKSYGYKDLNQKSENTLKTKYNLGSIMKNLTKVLVLQQVEDGKLNLDDSLATFELGFPTEIASKVTVRHLLNHSAGFADIFIAEYRENQLWFDTLDKKLELLKKRPLLFEPGTENRYSNYGYIVLGAILEKISGTTFENLLISRIFEPLRLSDSAFKPNENDPNQSARYSYLYDGSLHKVGVTEHPGPDGGVEATAADVQKFYRELYYGDKLLNRASPIVRNAFAMDGPHWAAYGGGLGVSAAVEVDLNNRIEIVVLANTDSLVAEYISGRLLTFIRDKAYAEIKKRPINFAYDFYINQGKDALFKDFKQHYVDAGYEQFIGRTLNELGMQLLENDAKVQAFDIFNYLVYLFPQAPQAYDSLAFAYHKVGQTNEAKKAFQKALTIKTDFQSDYVSDNYGLPESSNKR